MLRNRLKQKGIDLDCRYRFNCKNEPKQDDRKLSRYQKRWKVERIFMMEFNAIYMPLRFLKISRKTQFLYYLLKKSINKKAIRSQFVNEISNNQGKIP